MRKKSSKDRPYSNFNHPEKISSGIFPQLLPLSDLTHYSSTKSCDGDNDGIVKAITNS
jgi:hypothetical protein